MGLKSGKWFGFGYFLLPAVLKVLYVLCTIAMVACGVLLIVSMWSDINLETRILYIVFVALSPFFVRFVFEILLLPFRIAEDLRAIRLRYEQSPRSIESLARSKKAVAPLAAPPVPQTVLPAEAPPAPRTVLPAEAPPAPRTVLPTQAPQAPRTVYPALAPQQAPQTILPVQAPQAPRTIYPVQTPQAPSSSPPSKPVVAKPATLEGDRVAQALRTNDPFSAPPFHKTDREQ